MPDKETAHLVSMGNDIAINLSFQAGSGDKTAEHIRKYWAPRMRGLLIDHADKDAEGMSDDLKNAVQKLKLL
jgi:hypothetical protein